MTSDYYALLGIPTDATTLTIKQAAQAKLNQLKNAYEVLSHTEQRAAYDRTLEFGKSNHYKLLGVPQEASESAIKHAAQQQINQIKQSVALLADAHKRRAYDTELNAQLNLVQTDTGSFKIKPKVPPTSNKATVDFEQVLTASQHIPKDYNPYNAPDADLEGAEEDEYVLASRGSRLGASALDGLVFLVPILIALLVVFALSSGSFNEMLTSGEFDESAKGVLIAVGGGLLLLFLGMFVLNLVWLYRYGQTIGKRMLGIKIVRTDGSRCELWRIILLRVFIIQILSQIPILGTLVALGDPLMIFRKSRQCLHDNIADTIVVYV